jgi:hypothetical protein
MGDVPLGGELKRAVETLTNCFPRDAEGVPCACGGYADRADCTDEERKQYGCGRPFECCARAFVCRICKTRIVGSAEAPDYD